MQDHICKKGKSLERIFNMAIDKQRLLKFVQGNIHDCRILVIGDVMLDKYYYGEVTRISPEAPVPVNKVTSVKETMGGAANVAHNLALLGANTMIAGFVGDDFHCQSLMDRFTSRGIDYKGIIYRDKPTITKLRIIGGHQQMLRLDFEDTEPVESHYAQRLLNFLEIAIQTGLDGVIISDYGKGACTEEVCEGVIDICKNSDVPVFVDPKGWEWEKYSNADYITPNLKEINGVLLKPIKNKDIPIVEAAKYVSEKFAIPNVLVTRSECGMSFINEKEEVHIPTVAQEVFDVSGAGDTVLAVFTLAKVGGLSNEEAAYLANLAASVVVAKLGTYAVCRAELETAILKADLGEK